MRITNLSYSAYVGPRKRSPRVLRFLGHSDGHGTFHATAIKTLVERPLAEKNSILIDALRRGEEIRTDKCTCNHYRHSERDVWRMIKLVPDGEVIVRYERSASIGSPVDSDVALRHTLKPLEEFFAFLDNPPMADEAVTKGQPSDAAEEVV
jgi:hypothetical protein